MGLQTQIEAKKKVYSIWEISYQHNNTASDSYFLTAIHITAEHKLSFDHITVKTPMHLTVTLQWTNNHKTGTVSQVESDEMSVSEAINVVNSP